MLFGSIAAFALVIGWAMCSNSRGRNLWIALEIFGGLQGRLLSILLCAEAVYVTSAYDQQPGKQCVG
jgi:hypothetical protein